MPVDDRLLARIEQLEAKLHEMNRPRRSRWLAVLALGAIVGWLARMAADPGTAYAQQDGARDIVARSVKIVNNVGQTVLHLAADRNNSGSVRIHDWNAQLVAALESDPDGGLLRIYGHDQLERAFFGVADKQGGGYMHLKDIESKKTPVIMSTNTKGGYLSLGNLLANKRSVWLGTDDNQAGGVVFVYDKNGSPRVDLFVSNQGGSVNLLGSKTGKTQVFLGVGERDEGGVLLLRDPQLKVKAEMGVNREGGYVTLNAGKNDAPHVHLGSYEDQRGGLIQIKGNTGKVQVELGSNRVGDGYIDPFEKK